MKRFIFIFFGVLLGGLVSCTSQDDKGAQSAPSSADTLDSPSTSSTPSQDKALADAKAKITGILLAYYEALSVEEMDEREFFAPMVEKFYGQTQENREKIGQSIRNGFAGVEDRIIQLNRQSLEVRPSGEGYIATFDGRVQFTRTQDGTWVKEDFRNQVAFNKDFLITRYEALNASQETQTRSLNQQAAKAASSGPQKLVQDFLSACQRGDFAAASTQCIHPRQGMLYITRPGAMDAVYQGTQLLTLFEEAYTPWMNNTLQETACDLQEEEIPEFDCEKFSKEGCFLAPVEGYARPSELMNTLNKYELGEYNDRQISAAKNLEKWVTHQVLITDKALALYLGEIDGKWYILVMDIASYDCSA